MKIKTKTQRRRTRVRSKIVGTAKKPRLSVHRTNKHIYSQLIDDENGKTLVSVNESKVGVKKDMNKSEKARAVGKHLAKEAVAKKIRSVVLTEADLDIMAE